MKKLLLFLCLLPLISSAQINKGNWLVGGVLGGQFSKGEDFSNTFKEETTIRSINLIGQVAYFPVKKLAIGLNAQSTSTREQYRYTSTIQSFDQTYETSDNIFAVGPFLRYYLLSPDNKFNFYFQGSFQRGTVKRETLSIVEIGSPIELEEANLTAYHLSAAPVYMINKKVALEFMLNYSRLKHFGESNRFSAGIGLQVHLGK